MASVIIPQALKDIASDLGCNVINYVTTTKDGEIFSLAATDESGNYLPIGLPMLFAVKGDIITELSDNIADKILSNVKE